MCAKDYYKGAYRITINGVPLRITQKPTAHMLAVMRENTNPGIPSPALRDMAEVIRYAETTYLPPEH